MLSLKRSDQEKIDNMAAPRKLSFRGRKLLLSGLLLAIVVAISPLVTKFLVETRVAGMCEGERYEILPSACYDRVDFALGSLFLQTIIQGSILVVAGFFLALWLITFIRTR